uniref:Major capsid protein N-terminal domain-containing protein n=1 Tax=viral metagenome TaxID=1070528 RepID=A0A6C0ICC2_9ZZZZ
MAAAADRRPGTSIEGALYDLVARGKKDTFFIRDSKESENLFDARYETVPAYIPELRKIVPRNRIQWGTTCEFEIEKAGDILIEPTLLIDLPSWLPTAAAKANNNSVIQELGTNNRYGYTNGIAYFLFEKIQFYQDNILLQEFSGDSLFAQRHLKGTYNSSFLEDALTGVHDGSPFAIQRNATPGRLRLRLPLPFCQHADEGGLPLCATLTQQFRLRLTLRRLEDLVEAALPCSPVKPAPWGKTFSFGVSLQRESIAHPTILLENRQLYIGPNAQSAFQQMNEEYVIPYSRLYENSFTFGPTDYAALQSGLPMTKRLIDGRHPAEQIFWFVRSRDDIAANRLWHFEASNTSGQYYNTINLTVAGKSRETDWTPLVWTDIETHAKLERDSGRSIGVMNWSYGMSHSMRGPIEMQPTGTLNFTSADRPTLYVALTAANTSNTIMNLLVDGYATYEIKKGGRGGLLYAS